MTMDGDLQGPPEVITEFAARRREGNDVVYAVRKPRGVVAVLARSGFLCYVGL